MPTPCPSISRALMVLALAAACSSCASYYRRGKHDLAWTRGQVKFATSARRFYAEKWIQRVRANRRRVCAGFVHKETFGRYLKFGNFFLHIKLEVIRGGSPMLTGGRITGWQGGQIIRTRQKVRGVGENQDVYIFCSRRLQGAKRTVGAMKYTFSLRRTSPPMIVPLAKGIVQITP